MYTPYTHSPTPVRLRRRNAMKLMASRLSGNNGRDPLVTLSRASTPDIHEDSWSQDALTLLRWQTHVRHNRTLRSPSMSSSTSMSSDEMPELSFDPSRPSTPSSSSLSTPSSSRLHLSTFVDEDEDGVAAGYGYDSEGNVAPIVHEAIKFPILSQRTRPSRSKASVWRGNLTLSPSTVSRTPSHLATVDASALLASLAPLPRFNPYFRPRAVSMSSVVQKAPGGTGSVRPRRKSTAGEQQTSRAAL